MKYPQKTHRRSGKTVDKKRRREQPIMQSSAKFFGRPTCIPATQCTDIDPNPVARDGLLHC
jgi:hypothetical protein